MQVETKTVQDGQHNGKTVWICHYHRPDLDKKPLRNVPPTKVIVCSNDELPKNKTVYYSQSHFRPINAKGKATAKVISPVDNTGFRSRQGSPLYVFDNEAECIAAWNAQLDEHERRVDVRIATAADYWKEEKTKLVNLRRES
jgi:hypothetical protein